MYFSSPEPSPNLSRLPLHWFSRPSCMALLPLFRSLQCYMRIPCLCHFSLPLLYKPPVIHLFGTPPLAMGTPGPPSTPSCPFVDVDCPPLTCQFPMGKLPPCNDCVPGNVAKSVSWPVVLTVRLFALIASGLCHRHADCFCPQSGEH